MIRGGQYYPIFTVLRRSIAGGAQAGLLGAASQGAVMDAEQRYLLDLQGFLVIKGALSPVELEDARRAADAYSQRAFAGGELPPGFERKGARSSNLQHAVAFDRALEWLCWHPKVWPVVCELTGGQPQMNGPGTMIVDDAEQQLTVGAQQDGAIGWHCAREIGDLEGGAYDASRARAAASCFCTLISHPNFAACSSAFASAFRCSAGPWSLESARVTPACPCDPVHRWARGARPHRVPAQ